jgi:hypothetical protein
MVKEYMNDLYQPAMNAKVNAGKKSLVKETV